MSVARGAQCPICNSPVKPGKLACSNCGTRVDVFERPSGAVRTAAGTRHNQWIAIVLALLGLLGVAGLHRLYVGRTLSGIAMLLTIGGLGIWTLVDLHNLWEGDFVDAQGLALREHR